MRDLRMTKRPLLNGYCEKCKHHYSLDGDESRCKKLKIGMSDIMCVQVVECPCFADMRKKVE